jgi:hypothetical protein
MTYERSFGQALKSIVWRSSQTIKTEVRRNEYTADGHQAKMDIKQKGVR